MMLRFLTGSIHKTLGDSPFISLCLLVFWGTALLAVPFAYSPIDATIKLGVLTAAVLVYFAMLRLGDASVCKISLALSLLGVVIALLFLLSHDWKAQPADYKFIDRIAAGWMSLRPDWLAADPGSMDEYFSVPNVLNRTLSQNVAGGLLAALLPFTAAWAIGSRLHIRDGRWADRLVWIVCVGVISLGLLLSSSRAAIAALSAAAVIWLIWQLSRRLPGKFGWWRAAMPFVTAAVILLLGGLAAARSGATIVLLDRTPGFPSAASRAQIASDAIRLAGDFPIVGGGLHMFPGLYSTYMRVIPYYLFGYSHNLYLDVAVEQGAIGLLALTGVLAASIWASVQAGEAGARHPAGLLGQAAFLGIVTMVLHGMLDDPFYGEYGMPLLFILPAAAVFSARLVQRSGNHLSSSTMDSDRQKTPSENIINVEPTTVSKRRVSLLIGFALFGAFLILLFGRSLIGVWISNLAAVKMAKIQLEDFPAGHWEDEFSSREMEKVENLLQQALYWDPENRTANQRLGLISMLRNDYPTACSYLLHAYRADPGHRGVVKNLGYCLTWTGRYGEALTYLREIPEARQELDAYAAWWPAHARPDLAINAQIMRDTLMNE